jgi:hypothetical protein
VDPPAEPGVQIAQASDGARVVRRWYHDQGGRMVFTEHRYDDALTHLYEPTGPGEPIPLYAGEFRAGGDATGQPYTGGVAMHWFPNPHILASGGRSHGDLMGALGAGGSSGWEQVPTLDLVPGATGVPVPPVEPLVDPFEDTSIEERTRFDIQQEIGERTGVDRVTFLVPNGWALTSTHGICDPDRPEVWWAGRIVATSGDWRVTIDQRREVTRAYWSALRDTGQSAVTQVGQVERVDGAPFDVEDAAPVLDAIRLALHVALGRVVSLLLPVGWRGDQPVWTQWRAGKAGAIRGSSRFLDDMTGAEQVRELIERFLDYCTTEKRRDVIHHAVGYYIAVSREAASEQRIGSAVSGLQLLAHHRHMDEQSDFSKGGWKDLNAEGQIRHLLGQAGVRTAVPSSFTYLQAAASGLPLDPNGRVPDALRTSILMRNQSVHPVTGTPSAWDNFQWWEAMAWAGETLLLAVLRVVGYTGQYRPVADTVGWAGQTMPVPWAPPITAMA